MGRYSENVKDSGQPKELIFTGKMITADEALGIGLVNKVVGLDTKSDVAMRFSSEEAEEGMRKFSTHTEKENALTC
jgi:enoyl-CoA hydratase/carnithine racemase